MGFQAKFDLVFNSFTHFFSITVTVFIFVRQNGQHGLLLITLDVQSTQNECAQFNFAILELGISSDIQIPHS